MIAFHRRLAAGEAVTPAPAQAQRRLGATRPAAVAGAARSVSVGTGAAQPAAASA